MELPPSDVLQELYGRLAPAHFFTQLLQEFHCSGQGIYVPALVIWLMLRQQLYGQGTLAEAVQQVVLGEPRRLLPEHKRVREQTVSTNTGGYSQARSRLPLKMLEKVARQIFQDMLPRTAEAGFATRVYLLDGSGLLLPHTQELTGQFPPAVNQRGVSHWPVVRLVVAHNLANGAALLPCWGPMFGKRAVSEQALAEQLMDRLPARSTIVGDRNFGVFSVAFAACSKGHEVLIRLTKARAQRLSGGTLPRRITDLELDWVPSRDERRKHPRLPAEAHIRGRLIVAHLMRHGQVVVLYLFTTLSLPAEEIIALYGRRWNIETDLRSLKHTVRLGDLRAKSAAMVSKELLSAVMAYNLVRAVQLAAAQSVGLDPRDLSFARVRAVVTLWLPIVLAAGNPEERSQLTARMLSAAARTKLLKRRRRRRYPRAVWGRPRVFPTRKANK